MPAIIMGRDHPRPCGEKRAIRHISAAGAGSPPPMRGKGTGCGRWTTNLRITPAHAGKSVRCMCINFAPKDHPRPCGEKFVQHVLHARLWGSPPPMRGKVPAGAALSPAPAPPPSPTWGDHPRPCGEKLSDYPRGDMANGSPPPMRGKAYGHNRWGTSARITPAHAGKSILL